MNSKRIYGWAVEYLNENGVRNTHQIMDHIKGKSKFGVSPRTLVNMMSSEDAFTCIGSETIEVWYGKQDVPVWGVNPMVVNNELLSMIKDERAKARQRKRRLYD